MCHPQISAHTNPTQTPGKFQKLGQMSPAGSFALMYSHQTALWVIHPKSKNIGEDYFSVQKNWQKKCVNRNDEIPRKSALNMKLYRILWQKKHINLQNMIFMCVYVRFKQRLNMIVRKLAVLSLNTVQTWWVPRSQPKIWRKSQKIGSKDSCFLDVCFEYERGSRQSSTLEFQ